MARSAEQEKQFKTNRRRTNAMLGTVVGGNAAAVGNVAHKRVKLHRAVKDFNTRPRNDLGEAFKASHNVNQAVRGVKRSGKISAATAVGGLALAGATGTANERSYKKASMKKNNTVSAFGVDHA